MVFVEVTSTGLSICVSCGSAPAVVRTGSGPGTTWELAGTQILVALFGGLLPRALSLADYA